MEAFEGIAHSKSSSNPTEYQRWRESLAFARSSLAQAILNDQGLLDIAQNAPSVHDFNILAKYLYQSSKAHPDSGLGTRTFFQAVDESPFSLEEWIEGLSFFDRWLKMKGQGAGLLTMLGYLRCCSEAAQKAGLKLRFVQHLEEMLETHGFEGAV